MAWSLKIYMCERVAIYQHSHSNGIWLKTGFQARIIYIDETKDKMYKVVLAFPSFGTM